MKAARVVLTIIFLWSLSKTIEMLFRPGSLDRLLFEGAQLSWMFWVILMALAILQFSALYYLWRPTPAGYRLAQAAIALGAFETIVAAAIGFRDPERLKQAIVQSRTERGLPVRDELLRMAENPAIQLFPVVLAILLASAWLTLLFVIRRQTTAPSAIDARSDHPKRDFERR